MSHMFAEMHQVVPAIIPVDLKTGANAGDWVSMKGYKKCTVIVFRDVGDAAEPPVIKLQQATAVAGTSAKDLLFTTIHHKTDTVLTATGVYTKVTQAAATSWTDTGNGAKQSVSLIDIDAAMLDADNGFDCVQVSIADVGAVAQLGCALYILWNPRHAQESLPSAIVD